MAKFFRFLCWCATVVLVALALMALFDPAEVRGGVGAFRFEKMKPEYLWLKRPLVLLLLTIPATFVWLSFRLFTLYGQGVLFSDANVRYIKGLGYWMIGTWAVSLLIQLLQFLQQTERFSFAFTIDGYFFGGVLVLLLAWIMEEGKKLQDDQALTV